MFEIKSEYSFNSRVTASRTHMQRHTPLNLFGLIMYTHTKKTKHSQKHTSNTDKENLVSLETHIREIMSGDRNGKSPNPKYGQIKVHFQTIWFSSCFGTFLGSRQRRCYEKKKFRETECDVHVADWRGVEQLLLFLQDWRKYLTTYHINTSMNDWC